MSCLVSPAVQSGAAMLTLLLSIRSNKIVPQIYRSIIDDVIANIHVDFEEYGMEEEVLNNLQAKWEAKLLETRVADFARAPGSGSTASPEPDPVRDAQAQGHDSTLPNPPGPSGANGGFDGYSQGLSGGLGVTAQGLALPGMQNGARGYGYDVGVKTEPDDLLRMRGGASSEVDLKPYIPQSEPKPEPNAAGLLPGDEVIDSDLDDSDDELRDDGDEGGDDGEIDIVFCVYDKVQRVKNKWKTVFKDGMIHINGRDYLFAKCNGEFEW